MGFFYENCILCTKKQTQSTRFLAKKHLFATKRKSTYPYIWPLIPLYGHLLIGVRNIQLFFSCLLSKFINIMKKIILSFALLIASFATTAQVGFGTTSPEGALDVVSSNSGIIVPRVANTAAITSPVNGMLMYDLSTNSSLSDQVRGSGFSVRCIKD